MQILARVTAIGDLKTLAPREGSQYQNALTVRSIEAKWFMPRNTQGGTKAVVTGAGLELRNNLATDCRLQVGDWIAVDADLYTYHYTDSEGKVNYGSHLVVGRYALVTDFGELT